MLNAIFRPIEAWQGTPTPAYKRERPRFSVTFGRTLEDLERELLAIHAKDIVIQCYLELKDIRNDGWPRSSASPSQPGIILSFLKGQDTISMPCDTYQHWHQNLRAIALTLHALRMVSQYGVTTNNQQYEGFKRLAPASAQSEREWAAKFLTDATGVVVTQEPDAETLDRAYKAAALKMHPDRGGTQDEFVRMRRAVEILKGLTAACR